VLRWWYGSAAAGALRPEHLLQLGRQLPHRLLEGLRIHVGVLAATGAERGRRVDRLLGRGVASPGLCGALGRVARHLLALLVLLRLLLATPTASAATGHPTHAGHPAHAGELAVGQRVHHLASLG